MPETSPVPLAVVPLLASKRLGPFSIWIVSLEIWDESFHVRYCLAMPARLRANPIEARVRWSAVDDCGNRYRSTGAAAFGGEDWEISSRRFSPRLHPGSKEVRLTAEAITRDGEPEWTLVVPVPAQPVAG